MSSTRRASELKEIPIEMIVPSPFQPRKDFPDASIQELAESIRATGGLIQPVVVRPGPDQNWELVAGERRWRALQRTAARSVPALVRYGLEDEEVAALAMLENLDRENLSPAELSAGIERLVEEFGFTQAEVGKLLGKSVTVISRLAGLRDLAPEVLGAIDKQEIKFGHAKALLPLDAKQQVALLEDILTHRLNVRQTEARSMLIRGYGSGTQPRSGRFERLGAEMTERLQVPVRLQHAANGQWAVDCSVFSTDELQHLLARFQEGLDSRDATKGKLLIRIEGSAASLAFITEG